MLEYAPVPRIVRRGIYKNKIVWLTWLNSKIWRPPRKKSGHCTNLLRNHVNSRKSGYLLTVPWCHDETGFNEYVLLILITYLFMVCRTFLRTKH